MTLKLKPRKLVNKNIYVNKRIGKLSKIHGNVMYRASTKNNRDNYKTLELQKTLSVNNPTLRKSYNSNETAKEILNIMGASCIVDPTINRIDYSLVDTQLDTELILNPNKVDFKDLKILKKGKITFDKIIKNTNDPFYSLDEEISQNYVKQNNDLLQVEEMDFNFVSVVSGISNMNIYSPHSPSVRALKRTQ